MDRAASSQNQPDRAKERLMIRLFSYPELYGVADNNPFGLKVFAFLKLCDLAFEQEHIFDAKAAPRAQLPYIVDGGETIGDSDPIMAHLVGKYRLAIDDGLTTAQRNVDHLARRMLDGFYWIISYSRWRDPQFWPLFRDAILRTHPQVTAENMEAAQSYNFQRYHYQGIGRYEPADVYKKGIADLRVLANLIGKNDFLFGTEPRSVDAAVYGFLANIYFYDIDTPLKRFVVSRDNLVPYCERMHARVMRSTPLSSSI
jgi:glutathione S-transferase